MVNYFLLILRLLLRLTLQWLDVIGWAALKNYVLKVPKSLLMGHTT